MNSETGSFDQDASQISATRRSASYFGLEMSGKPPPPELFLPAPDKAKVPRVATFFCLYPETLGFDDGATFCIALGVPIRGFGKTAMHIEEGEPPFWLHPILSQSIVTSIRFHRGKRKQDAVEEHDERLISVVRSVEGESFPGFTENESDQDSGDTDVDRDDQSAGMFYTVVEMSTQLAMPATEHWEACEPNDTIMGPTLTRCINGLMQVIDAYRFGEKVALASPAREQLGPGIIAATRPADPNKGGWDSPARYVINVFATYGGNGFVMGSHSPSTYKNMSTYLALESSRHPVAVLGRIQSELQHAMFREGNFLAALMFAHSASEIMMDAALMAMQFEDEMSPEDAARAFIKPLKTRILSEFHDRLGGTWSTETSNPVGIWIRDVLLIRHRVAHAGYLPFYEEAQAAHDAHFALGTYLRDRLASKAKHYPFSSGLLVTGPGFERRGIRTKAAEKAVGAANDRLEEFTRWRDRLVGLRG